MRLLQMSLAISPIIMIGSVLLIIISLSTKNNTKKNNILLAIGIISISIYIFTLMGIIVPYAFLTALFKNYIGIIGMLTFIFTVWLLISLTIQFKNRLLIFKNNEKEIYVRDVNVEYSPAVLSYLINNRIETKKDLPATLLNLCANNVVKVEKNTNGEINIIDLKNEKEVEKLTLDEKYAYEMLITKVTKSKILNWKNIVREEYEKYQFSKSHKTNLFQYLGFLYVVLFIIIFIVSLFNVSNDINIIFAYLIPIIFLSAWEISIFSGIKAIITANKKTEFIDTYTRKGAIEYNRWKKFEKFIEEYTLIKEKNFENIIILGKYLSYSIALGINEKCDKELYNKINTKFSFDFKIFSSIFKD